MKIKRNQMFWAPDGDEGGAGLMEQMGPLHDEASAAGEETPPTETPTETKTDPEPKTPSFDPNAFAKTFGESFAATVAKQPPKEEKRQLSPEEAKKALNVWDPDDEFIKEFNNMETQKGAMTKLRDFLIKQADTITQVRLAELQRGIEERFMPMVQAAQRVEAEATQRAFSSSYGELAKPELQPLMTAVVQQLVGEGVTFKSQAEGFREVAKRMEKVIQVHNPSFKLSSGTTPAKKSSEIPVTTPGAGGGGGGGKSGGGPKKSALLEALGPLGT